MGGDAGFAFHHSDQRVDRRSYGNLSWICVPQIVAAVVGGRVLRLFTAEGSVPPEVNMLVLAGVLLVAGACCVGIIKEAE